MTIDWTKPIEAYHEDGRVVPVKRDCGPDSYGDYSIASALEPKDQARWFRSDGTQAFILEDGNRPWRIRNRTPKPTAPVAPGTLTLRDQFAMAALPAIIAATSAGQHSPGKGFDDDRRIVERMAEDAYNLADAMLAERNRERDA